MDIDVKLLKGLAQDKEIPFDVLVGAIESALLIAYHRPEGSHRRARVEHGGGFPRYGGTR